MVTSRTPGRLGDPADVKADFRSSSILEDGRMVFNLCGNRYRLVV
ncbi:MAG: type II toxin-antitoxin system HigB family toxin [Thiocapsa sp.]|nr:type II toxin-antitoxin system HigB family toxin [Thiocapsa sp.]MCG6896917.1 type II toxin-antitoxin system HigB family toxin [Thiocapsa sp.]MCG6985540.1 type II toxin-antitoxin system HigB family toxin [Thiocapsa sp.]